MEFRVLGKSSWIKHPAPRWVSPARNADVGSPAGHANSACRLASFLLRRLFGLSGSDCRFHLAALFGRGEHGWDTERLQPQFTAPALGMIQVFVFLIFDRV